MVIQFLGYVPYDTSTLAFGDRLVFMRRLSGISQKELAHRLDVDPTTLARWERGKGRPLEWHQKRMDSCLAPLLSSSDGIAAAPD